MALEEEKDQAAGPFKRKCAGAIVETSYIEGTLQDSDQRTADGEFHTRGPPR